MKAIPGNRNIYDRIWKALLLEVFLLVGFKPNSVYICHRFPIKKNFDEKKTTFCKSFYGADDKMKDAFRMVFLILDVKWLVGVLSS